MHPRTRELIEYLDAQHAALHAAVLSVPRDLRERRPTAGGWSVAEVLEHMARVDERLAGVLQRMLETARGANVGAETDTSSVLDATFQERLRDRTARVTATEASLPTGTLDATTAWTALDARHSALREAVLAGDGLALGGVALPHPRFGPLDWYQWVAFAAGHEGRHAAQVREIAEQLVGER